VDPVAFRTPASFSQGHDNRVSMQIIGEPITSRVELLPAN